MNVEPISEIVMSDLCGDEYPVLGFKEGLDLENLGESDGES